MPNEVAGSGTLQTAAEPVQPAPEAPETAAGEQVEGQSQAGEEKSGSETVLTQDEVDRIIKNRLSKEQRKYQKQLAEAEARERAYRELLESRKQSPAESLAQASDGEPKRDNYATYEEYIEARAEWRAERALEKRLSDFQRQSQQQTEQERMRALEQQFAEREDAARERYDDYDDAVSTVRGLPKHVVEFIGEAETGPDVLYALANDPQLLAKLKTLSPVLAIRELTRLEGKATPKPKAVSKAPEPVKPIAGRNASAEDAPSERDSDEEWLRKREAQLRSRRA